MDMKLGFRQGLKDGLPIGLGYLSVSFTFGIMAILAGLYWWEAVLISMLNVTSAGQLAGIQVMLTPGRYVEMLISQLTINVRYSFMSISLSQKVTRGFSGIWRWLFGFMITDEIFAVAVSKPVVRRKYFAGLMVMPYIGWTGGTLAGALLGDVLPASVMSALGIAIYAMFVAIVVPEMKKRFPVVCVVILAAGFSCLFTYVPGLKEVPAGLAISICAVVAAVLMALIRPLSDEELATLDEAGDAEDEETGKPATP
ncbi:MAG: AzlC family ABC transporter permease [Eubacterium sp.]|nr:AzlC family ABC transporter permease [Eubacterium sp.]